MEARMRGDQFSDGVNGNLMGREESEASGGSGQPDRQDLSKEPVRFRPTVLNECLDSEVPSKAIRRMFSAEYKRKILEEADACMDISGAIGALLRREGLYSSHLTTWRKQRDAGQLYALTPKKRGRKGKHVNPLSTRVQELENKNRHLQKQLEKAEMIIAFQKKLSEILGIPIKQEIFEK
jgi:transposase